MNAGEAIAAMLKERGRTATWLGRRYGMKYPNSFGTVLRRGSIRTDKFVKLCSILGYDVVLRPKHSGRRMEGEFTLDYRRGNSLEDWEETEGTEAEYGETADEEADENADKEAEPAQNPAR